MGFRREHPPLNLANFWNAVRRKPDALLRAVLPAVCFDALRPVAAAGLPRHTLPRSRHFMLAFVPTQGDSHQRVIAPFDRPFPNGVSNCQVVCGIQPALAVRFVRVWRVEEHAGQTLLDCWSRPTDAGPVPTADANA